MLRNIAPDRAAKLQKALDLLQECGFNAVLIDNSGTNDLRATALLQKAVNDPNFDEMQSTVSLLTLTPQQSEILKSIGAAKANKLIAYELGITETTVKAHVTNIYRKLGVRNRSEALVLMQKLSHAGLGNSTRVEQSIAV
jgi:DNA-binding NarL/FixJ family response regulator